MSEFAKPKCVWLNPEGEWVEIPRMVCERAGYTTFPCLIEAPDGSVRRVVEEGASE